MAEDNNPKIAADTESNMLDLLDTEYSSEDTTVSGSNEPFTHLLNSVEHPENSASGACGLTSTEKIQATFASHCIQDEDFLKDGSPTGYKTEQPGAMQDERQWMSAEELHDIYFKTKHDLISTKLSCGRLYREYYWLRSDSHAFLSNLPPGGDITRLTSYHLSKLLKVLEDDMAASKILFKLSEIIESYLARLQLMRRMLQKVEESAKEHMKNHRESSFEIFWPRDMLQKHTRNIHSCREKLLLDWRRLGQDDLDLAMFIFFIL